MANITTPNMGLIEPGIGSESSPTWASDLNGNFGVLDSHNHSAGSGVQITQNGIDLTGDLSFNANNATNLRTARFVNQMSAISGAFPDQQCAYSVGTDGDLYWNDLNGNMIPITTGGHVNSGAGSISGLVSPASASYTAVTQTFTWSAASNVGANMDFASAILRYPGSYPAPSGSNYIILEVPSSISAGYAITLPVMPPASLSVLTMGNSGVMGTATPDGTSIAISGGNLVVATNAALNGTITATTAFSAPEFVFTATGAHLTTISGPLISANVGIQAPNITIEDKVFLQATSVGTFGNLISSSFLNNNKTASLAASFPTIDSGEYTPSFVSSNNATGWVPESNCAWIRIGNTIWATGRATVSSSGGSTQVTFNLPISTTIGSSTVVQGVGTFVVPNFIATLSGNLTFGIISMNNVSGLGANVVEWTYAYVLI